MVDGNEWNDGIFAGASPTGGMPGIHPPRSRNPGGISPALFEMDRLMLTHLIAHKNMNQITRTRIYNRQKSVDERNNDLVLVMGVCCYFMRI